MYAWEIRRRSRRFDRGRGVIELDRPVISVGNLSVGGTGKTPMVGWLVGLLRNMGHWPCVAMRGYGPPQRRGRESDEAREHLAKFDDLPLVAQPRRIDGLIELFATENGERVDCVVLDDGFQHRQIARDLDIVLVDATRSPFEDALLPRGWLREPPSSLARAHVAVITHADRVVPGAVRSIREGIRGISSRALIVEACHQWQGIEVHSAKGTRAEPVERLKGRRVLAACAIGNPGPFLETARSLAGALCGTSLFPDHDALGDDRVREIAEAARESRADLILVTAKDWTKLRDVKKDSWPCPVGVAMVDLELGESAEELGAAVADAISRGRSGNK